MIYIIPNTYYMTYNCYFLDYIVDLEIF